MLREFGTQKFGVSFLVAAILAAAGPVEAKAACWSPDAIAAAKIRDFETMLMVSALRCRTSEYDFLPTYNAFVRTGRTALSQANTALRTHFAAGASENEGLNAYDRYVTSGANRYGAGVGGLGCKDLSSIASAAAAQGNDLSSLLGLADRAEMIPVLNDKPCPLQIAHGH